MHLKVHDSWELHCGWLEAELSRTRYGYAMTPYPNVGGLDLAGLFMQRKKFIETGVYFSKLFPLWALTLFQGWHWDMGKRVLIWS